MNRLCKPAIFAIVGVLLAFPACGDFDQAATPAAVSKDEPVTLMIMGGFLSCRFFRKTNRMDMVGKYRELYQRLRATTGAPIKVIRSCYNYSRMNLRYSIGTGKARNFKISTPEFIRLAASQAQGRVYMVGHSYGGWLAMRIVLEIAKRKTGKAHLRRLYTIDPISWEECTRLRMTKSYLASTQVLQPAPACTRAPADLKPHYRRIAELTPYWHHFYQAEFVFTHSSQIFAADATDYLSYGFNLHPAGAHYHISEDPRVWNKIYKGILSDTN